MTASASPTACALRILFLAPEEGAPTHTGGGQRTHHLFRALSVLGEVDVLVSAECLPMLEADLLARCRLEFQGAACVALHRSRPTFVYPPTRGPLLWRKAWFAIRRMRSAVEPRRRRFEPTAAALAALDALIDERRYDVIVGRYLRQTAVSGALEQPRVPVLCDLDDLDEVVLETRIRALAGRPLKALLARWGLRQIEGFAPALRRRCKHLWVASEIDRALVSHPSVSVLSNIPFSPNGFPSRSTPTRRDHRVALFVGSYVHTANRSGLVDFVARVWPEIRRRCGDAELRIVGSGGWDRMASELLAPGVEIVGAVDELSREYADASFAVVPVREGAGTKIKVAEALAFGRAVVAYDHAVRGYEPLVGNGLVSVWSDKDMVAACLDLFAHPDRRDELAARGHALARASFSYRGFEREVVESTVRAARQRVLEGSEV